MEKEKHYCDNCGAVSENPFQEGWDCYAELPFDVASANEGESAIICGGCKDALCKKHEPIRFYQLANYGGLQYWPWNEQAKALLEGKRKTIEFGAIIQAIRDGKKVQMRFGDKDGQIKWIDWTIS